MSVSSSHAPDVRQFAAGVLALTLWLWPASAEARETTVERALESVVTVSAGAAEGSGFAFGGNGRIVTNLHVVGEAGHVRITAQRGRDVDGRIVARDRESDLALIQTELELRPLRGRGDPPNPGEEVFVIGSPLGLRGSVAKGVVSAVRRMRSLGPVIQTDAPVNSGNSGGPLIDARGNVLGVNTSKSATGEGIAFAVPIARAAGLQPSPAQTRTDEHASGVAWPFAVGGALMSAALGLLAGLVLGRRRTRQPEVAVTLKGERSPHHGITDVWTPDERVLLKTDTDR